RRAMTLPTTLGELKQTEWASPARRNRTVKDEMRENLICLLENGTPLFPGIVGYEETVIPQADQVLPHLVFHGAVAAGGARPFGLFEFAQCGWKSHGSTLTKEAKRRHAPRRQIGRRLAVTRHRRGVAVHLDEVRPPRLVEGVRRRPHAHRPGLTGDVEQFHDDALAVIGGLRAHHHDSFVREEQRAVLADERPRSAGVV